MVYTNQLFENKEFEFPPPPMWLTWMQSWEWDPKARTYTQTKNRGNIRHQESLAKAKNYVGRYAQNGKWTLSWAIYEWTGSKYELRYKANENEKKADHPLWSTVIRMTKLTGRDATEEELDEAMRSIMEAIGE